MASALRAGGVAPAQVEVTLSEFAITPAQTTVPAGSQLVVTNDGAVEHNLRIDGTATPMLPSGDTAVLDLAGLAPGTYTVICEVPGHEAAGMRTSLTIS